MPTPFLYGWGINTEILWSPPFPDPGSPPYASLNDPAIGVQPHSVGPSTGYPLDPISLQRAWRYYFGVGQWEINASVSMTADDGQGSQLYVVENPDPSNQIWIPEVNVLSLDTGKIAYGAGMNYQNKENSGVNRGDIVPGILPVGAGSRTPAVGVAQCDSPSLSERAISDYADFAGLIRPSFYSQVDSGYYDYFPNAQADRPFQRHFFLSDLVIEIFMGRGFPTGLLLDPTSSTGMVYLSVRITAFNGQLISMPDRNPDGTFNHDKWRISGATASLDGMDIALYELIESGNSNAGSINIRTYNMTADDFNIWPRPGTS